MIVFCTKLLDMFIVHCSTKVSIITPMMLKTLAASPKALSVGSAVSVGDTSGHTLGAL